MLELNGPGQRGGDDEAGTSPPSAPPPPDERAPRKTVHEVVHSWIPLLIVLASVLAAVMGWRASLADESSAHSEELSRQDLVQQQQLVVRDNHAIDSDVQTFGQFAQYSALAHSLRQDASKVGGTVRDQLQAEAQSDLGIARYLGKQIVYQNYAFDPSNPTGNPALRTDGTYVPGHPYGAAQALALAENSDTELHGLAPEQLHATAEAEHKRGVEFTGVAALFVSVMVLLTIAALAKGPPKVWLTASGSVLVVVGLVLFVLVQGA
jgi:hypothetical protein